MVIAVALLSSSAVVKAAEPAEAAARSRHTAADTPVELRAHAHWSSECRSATLPSVSWVDKPAHGHVDEHAGEITIQASSGGDKKCEGVEVHGLHLIYTPEAGFHGIDHVSYDLRYTPKEPVVHYAYDIKVD
jgi:hypothetical protein